VFQTGENKLWKFSDIKIRRHVSLKLNANPYLDRKYFLERRERRKQTTPRNQDQNILFVLPPITG